MPGGSTKGEIVQGLNTALAGERYSQEALAVRPETSDVELRSLLQMIASKQRHPKLDASRCPRRKTFLSSKCC